MIKSFQPLERCSVVQQPIQEAKVFGEMMNEGAR